LPGQALPGYVPTAAPNNVKDFFQTGTSSTTSLNWGAKTEFGNLNFSYSHLDETGFVKNNRVQRDNFSMGGNAKLTDKLTFNGTFNYVRTDFQNPRDYINGVRRAVKNGSLSMKIIDERVKEVLRVKFWLGLFDHLSARSDRSPRRQGVCKRRLSCCWP